MSTDRYSSPALRRIQAKNCSIFFTGYEILHMEASRLHLQA